MADFAEYERFDGTGLAELVRKGEVSAADLTEAAISRIEARNGAFNAVVLKLYDDARRRARAPLAGPFAGVPFLLKDLATSLEGQPTSNGNRRLKDIPERHDDEIVRRYRDAGLIVLGKTNVPEFGLAVVTESEALGAARNPWNPAHTPGGSSGGAAAAVAAGMTPFAHATDGGGSIRIPASHCGLFGLKPSRGRTPNGPLRGEGWRGLAIGHAITRSVRDSAALLDATQGDDLGAPYQVKPPVRPFLDEVGAPPGKLRIAVNRSALLAKSIHPDCVAALEASVKLLASLGHEIIEANLPFERDAFLEAFVTIVCAEVAADVRAAGEAIGRSARASDFEPTTYVLSLIGRSDGANRYVEAARYLQEWSRRVAAFMEGCDVLMLPTLAAPPPKIGQTKPNALEAMVLKTVSATHAGWFMRASGLIRALADKSAWELPFTPQFNCTGQPAASIPLYWNKDGLPMGTQFVARMGDEAVLFRLAAQLEQAAPWFDRRAKV